MRKTRHTLAAFIALICVSPIPGLGLDAGYSQKKPSKQPATNVPLSREDAVREAVFRYQFGHNASGLQQQAGYFFLSVGKGEDPSGALLARFAGHHPPVKKVSESTRPGDSVADKKTGKEGVVFRITEIKWVSETEAKVEGGYYEGNLSSSGNVYQVVYENDQWVVKKDAMQWIS